MPRITKGALVKHKDPSHLSHKVPGIVIKGPYESVIRVNDNHLWSVLVIDVVCNGSLFEKQPVEMFECLIENQLPPDNN